jgi:hypothetical protein
MLVDWSLLIVTTGKEIMLESHIQELVTLKWLLFIVMTGNVFLFVPMIQRERTSKNRLQ